MTLSGSAAANLDGEPFDRGSPGTWEWGVAIGLALVSIALVVPTATELWFVQDSWDFLTQRSLSSPLTMLEPHAGHWQSPTAVLYQILLETVGLDYWPWYFIPRLVGYAGLGLLVWWTLRQRGAEPVIALGVLSVMLVLGASGWHNASTIGNLIVLASLYVVALIVANSQEVNRRDLAVVGSLMILAIASSSLGLAAVAGLAISIGLYGRLRFWWPSIAVAVAVYGAWFMTLGGSRGPGPDLRFETLARVPGWTIEVFSAGLEKVLAIPPGLGVFVFVGMIGVIIVLAVRGKLGIFEISFLMVTVVYLAMITLVRIAAGQAQTGAVRYGFNLTFLLVPVLVPHLRFNVRRYVQIPVLAILIWLAIANLKDLNSVHGFWEARGQASREIVETAAALIAAGEPAVPTTSIDFPRAGMLTAARLEELVDEGWLPVGSSSESIIRLARGDLRVSVRPTGRIGGVAPTAAHGEAGCREIIPGESLILNVVRGGTISVEGLAGSSASLEWVDQHGIGIRHITLGGRGEQAMYVTLAAPDDQAEVTITTDSNPVIVCGLAESS